MSNKDLDTLHTQVTDLRTAITTALIGLSKDDVSYNYYTRLLQIANEANILVSDIKAIPEYLEGDVDYKVLAEELVLTSAVPEEFSEVVAKELVKNIEAHPDTLPRLPLAYITALFNYMHGNNPRGSKAFQEAIPKSHLWTQWVY